MSYLDRFRLDGRVAFVTGGAQGIGLAAAEALAEAGATVVTGDIKGGDIELDVTNSAAVADAADRVVADYGRIDSRRPWRRRRNRAAGCPAAGGAGWTCRRRWGR